MFNVGNSQEITILELARKIKELGESPSEILTVAYDQAYEAGFEDMQRRVPDISTIRSLVGYEPRVLLEEILVSVIEYFCAV